MACTHPFGVDAIRNETGAIIGARCPSCGRVAYKGDTFWTQLKRALGRVFA